MLLKEADPKTQAVEELEKLIASASGDRRSKLQGDLYKVRAGIKGENDAAYYINFDYKDHKNYIIIHDLRIELRDRVAQVDHLLLNRALDCFVLETKHFSGGLRITESGEFERWSNYHKRWEGMPSPLAQNERHLDVLREAFALIDMPTRLGIRLKPTFHSYVLISPEATIERPNSKNVDTSRIIKADVLKKTISEQFDKETTFEVLGSMAKSVTFETLEGIGRQLVALHKPVSNSWVSRFAIVPGASGPLPLSGEPQQPASPEVAPKSPRAADLALPKCKKCNSELLSIQYGPYGYYFKCSECQANTPAKVSCGKDGHKERLRKDGRTFYRECEDCKTSSIFYVNPK